MYPLLHGSELHQQLLHPVRLLRQLGPHDVSLDSLVNLHKDTGLPAVTLNKYGDYCEDFVGPWGIQAGLSLYVKVRTLKAQIV